MRFPNNHVYVLQYHRVKCRCVYVNFFPRDLNAAQRVVLARTSTSQLHTYMHIYISHNSVRQSISAFTLERRTPRIFFLRTNIIRLETSAEPCVAAVSVQLEIGVYRGRAEPYDRASTSF